MTVVLVVTMAITYFVSLSDSDCSSSIHRMSLTVLLKKSNFTAVVFVFAPQFPVHTLLISFIMGVSPAYEHMLS